MSLTPPIITPLIIYLPPEEERPKLILTTSPEVVCDYVSNDTRRAETLVTIKKFLDKIDLDETALTSAQQSFAAALKLFPSESSENQQTLINLSALLIKPKESHSENPIFKSLIQHFVALNEIDNSLTEIGKFLAMPPNQIEKNALTNARKLAKFTLVFFELQTKERQEAVSRIKMLLGSLPKPGEESSVETRKLYRQITNVFNPKPKEVQSKSGKSRSRSKSVSVTTKEPSPKQASSLLSNSSKPKLEKPQRDFWDKFLGKAKGVQKDVKNAFFKKFTSKKTPSIEPLTEDFEVANCQLSLEIEDAINKRIREAQELKKQQIETICKCVKLTFEHYIFALSNLSPSIIEDVKGELTTQMPILVEKFFFQDPRNVSTREKKIVQALLNQLGAFFRDYNTGKLKGYLATIRTNLVSKIRKDNKSLKEPDENDLQWVIYQQILQLIKILLFDPKTKDEKSNPNLPLFYKCLSSMITEFLERVLTPYSIARIIERFLNDLDLQNPDQQENKQSYDTSDTDFSKEIGKAIHLLYSQLIVLGEVKGMNVMSLIATILKEGLGVFSSSIGRRLQMALNKTTSSECTMAPVQFFFQLFFQKINEEYKPTTLLNKKSKSEQKDYQDFVAEKMSNKINPIIKEEVKKKNFIARKVGELVISFKSVEAFCNILCSKLLTIVLDETLLKTLFIYLISGLIKELQSKDDTVT